VCRGTPVENRSCTADNLRVQGLQRDDIPLSTFDPIRWPFRSAPRRLSSVITALCDSISTQFRKNVDSGINFTSVAFPKSVSYC
jgi:hypothetical protein